MAVRIRVSQVSLWESMFVCLSPFPALPQLETPDSCSLSLLGVKKQRLDGWACRLDWACRCIPGLCWQEFWVLYSWKCDGILGDWYHCGLRGKGRERCKLAVGSDGEECYFTGWRTSVVLLVDLSVHPSIFPNWPQFYCSSATLLKSRIERICYMKSHQLGREMYCCLWDLQGYVNGS